MSRGLMMRTEESASGVKRYRDQPMIEPVAGANWLRIAPDDEQAAMRRPLVKTETTRTPETSPSALGNVGSWPIARVEPFPSTPSTLLPQTAKALSSPLAAPRTDASPAPVSALQHESRSPTRRTSAFDWEMPGLRANTEFGPGEVPFSRPSGLFSSLAPAGEPLSPRAAASPARSLVLPEPSAVRASPLGSDQAGSLQRFPTAPSWRQ